jgi:hypothetical protein
MARAVTRLSKAIPPSFLACSDVIREFEYSETEIKILKVIGSGDHAVVYRITAGGKSFALAFALKENVQFGCARSRYSLALVFVLVVYLGMRPSLCNGQILTTLSAKLFPPAVMRYTTAWSPDPITLRILISVSEYSNSRITSEQARKEGGMALDPTNLSRGRMLMLRG